MPTSLQHRHQQRAEGSDTCGKTGKPESGTFGTAGERAGDFSRLAVHGKGIELIPVFGIQNPDRHQHIPHFSMIHVDLFPGGHYRVVADHSGLHQVIQRLFNPVTDTAFTCWQIPAIALTVPVIAAAVLTATAYHCRRTAGAWLPALTVILYLAGIPC